MQQNPNYQNPNINPENQDYQDPQLNANPSNQAYINTAPMNNTAQSTPMKSDTTEKIIKLVWFVTGFINVILIIRIIFSLFNAQSSSFSRFLYSVSNPFAMPFFGIFPMPGEGTTYFDTAALVAIVIYSLIAWGIVTLIKIMTDKQQVA